MTREPEWLDLTVIGSSYEEQLDRNADPRWGDRDRFRHRCRSFTGEQVFPWELGRAPEPGR